MNSQSSLPEAIFIKNVSRETLQKLEKYQTLLKKWQTKINLIAPSTLDQMWERHFEDSLQLLPYLPNKTCRLIDLGSGAGFPGLVLALAEPELEVTLIESDSRKCFFLENVSRETFSSVKVINARIESLPDMKADVITARALAPLEDLLVYAHPLMATDTICLFLKGKEFEKEVEIINQTWDFSLDIFPSLTDSGGQILKISDLKRRFSDE